jgi:catechol 2,3-dioxygenase-like lactoylglutathione lyase family enzyme
MMPFKGVHPVEFAVLDYEESKKFYDGMFGWLGYKSFWIPDTGYRLSFNLLQGKVSFSP